MVLTEDVELPTYEDLTVQEVNVSTPYLKAAALHLGKYCEDVNNEYMLCKSENPDPRKCLDEGKAVTACALKFFQMVKASCKEEMTTYARCLDQSSCDMRLRNCRNTQAIFDSCMLSKMNMERPPYGYMCEAKVHRTDRAKPLPEPPAYYPDAVPLPPSDDVPRQPAKYGTRYALGS